MSKDTLDKLDVISILQANQGAILERVNYEMGKIVNNIMDPNTSATAKRKLTIGITINPSADRRQFAADATVDVKLASTEPISLGFSIVGKPGSGELMVVENTPQIPGQFGLDGGEQAGPKVININEARG